MPDKVASPTASRGWMTIVADSAVIGKDTRIWHFAFVGPGARIGNNCTIGQSVHIGPGVVVGDGCKIQNGAQLFEGVVLEDDVFIGPHVVFTNVAHPRAHVNRRSEFEKTVVRRGASIGANATILCGTTIGEYAMVGAGAVVTSDVARHNIVVGTPARRAGFACLCGEKLHNVGTRGWHCRGCSRVYCMVYPRGAGTGTLEVQER